jgi:hypothetical protein
MATKIILEAHGFKIGDRIERDRRVTICDLKRPPYVIEELAPGTIVGFKKWSEKGATGIDVVVVYDCDPCVKHVEAKYMVLKPQQR